MPGRNSKYCSAEMRATARPTSQHARPFNGLVAAAPLNAGCTLEARECVEALRGLAHRAPNMALMVLFGSHARGDATAKSDLDVLYVERRSDQQLFGELEKTIRRSGMRYTIVPHTATTLKREMNLYGRMEYWAMREGVVIHDGSRAGKSILRHVIQYGPDTVRACAPQWMRVARAYINTGAKFGRDGRDGLRCHALYFAVASIVKAILTHNGVLFPFTRILRPLYDILPDKSIIDDVCYLDRVLSWECRVIDGAGRKTHSEAAEAARLTKNIYENANKSMHGKGKRDKETAVH